MGGVKKLFCKQTTDYIEINQFLTDTPVAAIPKTAYTLVFTADDSGSCPLCNAENGFTLEILTDNITTEYRGCRVTDVETTVAAGTVEKKILVKAETRNVK